MTTDITVDSWFNYWMENLINGLAPNTNRQTYIAMGTMFRATVNNDIIPKHPMDGVRYTESVRAV